jgi:hypothetical protein
MEMRATMTRSKVMLTKVAGSVALTLKSRLSITYVRLKADVTPSATPISVNRIP